MTPSINSPGEGQNLSVSSAGGATPSVSVGSITKGHSTQDTQGISEKNSVNASIPTNPNVAVLTPPKPDKPNAYLSGPHPNVEINIMMSKLEMTFPEIKKQLRESSLEDTANAFNQTISAALTKREAIKLQAAEHTAAAISAGLGAGISVVEIGSSLGNAGLAETKFNEEIEKHNAAIDKHIPVGDGENLAALRRDANTPPIPSQPDQGFGGEPGDIPMMDMGSPPVDVGFGRDVEIPEVLTPTVEDVEKKQQAWIDSPEGQAAIKENPQLQEAVHQKAEMMKKKPIMIQKELARLDQQTAGKGQIWSQVNKAGLEATHAGLKVAQGDLGVEEQTYNANAQIIQTRQRQKDQNLSDFGQTLDAIQRSKQEMLQTQRKGAQLSA